MYSGKEIGSSYQETWVKRSLLMCLSRMKNSLKFALKIIKAEQCFPSLQGTVSGVKLVTSPGLLAYFHLHQLSADTWVKTHRVRLLTLLFSKTL